jgi:sigma-54 specific flagellar transcriptional regulator A
MGFMQTSHAATGTDCARQLLAPLPDEEHVLLPTGESAAIQRLVRQIRQVARFDSRVLIMGATGTGKEIVARAIHALSPRRERLFVPINCGAIPAELLESELFGHVKGAFSGAIAARQGRFELAEGGTLFLDEIGEMSLAMQVKLLRVLQERCFERVGSSQSLPCDVRVIAATHRNLRQRVADGTFREDLYHRLNVVELCTPSLRERVEDLPELIENFIAQNLAAGRDEVRLGRRALAALRRYEWPGNVRELENLIERLAVMSGGQLVELDDLPEAIAAAASGIDDAELEAQPESVHQSIRDLPAVPERVSLVHAEATGRHLRFVPPVAPPVGRLAPQPAMAELAAQAGPGAALDPVPDFPPGGIDLAGRLRTIERRYMEIALEQSGGVLSRAAILLGLKRTTLMDKLRRHGLGGEAAADT